MPYNTFVTVRGEAWYHDATDHGFYKLSRANDAWIREFTAYLDNATEADIRAAIYEHVYADDPDILQQ